MIADKSSNARAARAETLGLVLIVVVIVVAALVRWGGHLWWGWR